MLKNGNHNLSPRAATEPVVELGLLADAVLRNGGEGEIVAAFQRSIYVSLNGHLICVGSRTLGSGPLHVLCDRWLADRVRVGQSAAVAGHALFVENAPLADFEKASIWKPDPAPNWSLSSLTDGLKAADAIWRDMPGDDGLASLAGAPLSRSSLLIAAARPGSDALVRMVERGVQGGVDEPANEAAIIDLIGMGPGLTPSGDDFLLGGLLALDAVGLLAMRNILWDICRPHLDRTNAISRAHLETAALGYGAAALHAAIHALIAGRTELLPHALSVVSDIGQTSGRDSFTGALLVLHAVSRSFARSSG